VEKEKNVSNEDLEDMETSPATFGEAVASEERHVVKDNALPTNPALPFFN
jgi:hypothetical protein